MGLFGNKKSLVPEWAPFFSQKEYAAFLSALDGYFSKTLGLAYEIRDGMVVSESSEFGTKELGERPSGKTIMTLAGMRQP